MMTTRGARVVLCACALPALASVSAAEGQDAVTRTQREFTAAEQEPPESEVTDDDGGEAAISGAELETLPGAGHAGHNRDVFLQGHPETDTLTRHWIGLGDDLHDVGITSTLNLWTVFQANVTGGDDTDEDVLGLYWLANHFDLEQMVGLSGASAYALVEGGWSDGVNPSVGALTNVNGTAVGDEAIGLTRLWYGQELLESRLRLRLGKLDITTENFEYHGHSVAFDAMPVANSPRTQFLASGLGNNASVPFPVAGLGAMLLIEPVERVYVAAAGVRSDADAFEISNPFDGDTTWMVAAEAGAVVPFGDDAQAGLYYAGYWYSEFPSEPSAWGLYLGAAQRLFRESQTDDQGLTAFARYGYADDAPSGIRHFWSLGGEYRGLLPGRDDDVLALGWSQAFTAGSAFAAPYEGVLECYYRARITPWFHVSPHVQYIANPGSKDMADAVTVGVRGQFTF